MGDAACRSTIRIIAHTTGPAVYPWISGRTCGFIFTTETMIDRGFIFTTGTMIDRGITTATGTMMMMNKP